ncbi:MAG: DUF2807 domain-containing protein [Bacteroidales bacterium]|nr:DUF2807 domain-containing protein [Bacteroidales bacterium]MBN2819379.1 DUF2807 domain-containing protein [Bacteroidales bacterium]
MKKFTLFLIFITSLVITSCEGDFWCLEGDGILETQERGITKFSGINVNSNFDVDVIYSTERSITVEADQNLQQYILTYVENGDLMLETDMDRCLTSANPIKVTVYCPLVESVISSGSGDVDIFDFEVDYFNVTLSGVGDISLQNLIIHDNLDLSLPGSGNFVLDGKASEAQYLLSGSGDIKGKSMRVNSCKTVLSGSGNIFTWVYNDLEIILTGSGNVYYYGDPKVIQRVTGSGSVIQY